MSTPHRDCTRLHTFNSKHPRNSTESLSYTPPRPVLLYSCAQSRELRNLSAFAHPHARRGHALFSAFSHGGAVRSGDPSSRWPHHRQCIDLPGHLPSSAFSDRGLCRLRLFLKPRLPVISFPDEASPSNRRRRLDVKSRSSMPAFFATISRSGLRGESSLKLDSKHRGSSEYDILLRTIRSWPFFVAAPVPPCHSLLVKEYPAQS